MVGQTAVFEQALVRLMGKLKHQWPGDSDFRQPKVWLVSVGCETPDLPRPWPTRCPERLSKSEPFRFRAHPSCGCRDDDRHSLNQSLIDRQQLTTVHWYSTIHYRGSKIASVRLRSPSGERRTRRFKDATGSSSRPALHNRENPRRLSSSLMLHNLSALAGCALRLIGRQLGTVSSSGK